MRTQAELTLIDLSRGVSARYEVSQWLGLSGARRGLFERRGVLVESDDPSSRRPGRSGDSLDRKRAARDGRALRVVALERQHRLPRGPWTRAGRVGVASQRAGSLWPDDVKPSTPAAASSAAALSVGELATAQAMASDAELSVWARRAADHADRGGEPGYLAVDAVRAPVAHVSSAADPVRVVGGAARLLLVDAPRAVDLALIRGTGRHPETLEQLGVALAVLAGGEITSRSAAPGTMAASSPSRSPTSARSTASRLASRSASSAFSSFPTRTASSPSPSTARNRSSPRSLRSSSTRRPATPGRSTASTTGVFRARRARRVSTTVASSSKAERGSFDAIATGEPASDCEPLRADQADRCRRRSDGSSHVHRLELRGHRVDAERRGIRSSIAPVRRQRQGRRAGGAGRAALRCPPTATPSRSRFRATRSPPRSVGTR